MFGSACYPYLRSYNRHKLEFRIGMCVFIGYNSYHKGYKCFHSSGRVYISNHVIFYETSFPYIVGSNFSSIIQSYNASDSTSTSTPSHTVFFVPEIQAPLATTPTDDHPNISSSVIDEKSLSLSSYVDQSPINTNQNTPPITSSPSHSPPYILPPPPPIGHPMITRSKAGIYKPKSYLASLFAKPTEPTSVSQALTNQKWFQAMQSEYQALQANNTWELVLPTASVKVVGNKWVFRIKYNPDDSIFRYKAKLVAKGFHQTQRMDYNETFSPVVKASIVRIELNLAVINKWSLR